jgi:tetratricopeptide (TPR) repeat protein
VTAVRRPLALASICLSVFLPSVVGWTQSTSQQESAAPLPSSSPSDDAQALIEIGTLQVELDEFESAETAYLEGIEILTDEFGEFSLQLIDPYRALATSYRLSGQYPEALIVLEQAQHISQRNLGLFNSEQLHLLDEMSRVYEVSGDTRGAHEIQQERLTIGLRQYGTSLQVLPYRYYLADYFERSRMRTKAREQYEEVLEVQNLHLDEHAEDRLKPLRALLSLDIIDGRRTSAERRIEEILALGTEISASERAKSMAVLGDLEMANGRREAGLDQYRAAYRVLAALDESQASELFAKPLFVDFVAPASPVDLSTRGDEYQWGTITVDFEISADGRARAVEIVSANPRELMESRYRRRLLEAHFRPRLVAAEPVATHHLRYTHEFRYFPQYSE